MSSILAQIPVHYTTPYVILGLGYVEQGMETQGSDGQQSDLFEGFKSVVG